MKITVNGIEIPLGTDLSLHIVAHVDEPRETIGPVHIDQYGGAPTIKGNKHQDTAMLMQYHGKSDHPYLTFEADDNFDIGGFDIFPGSDGGIRLPDPDAPAIVGG